MVNKDLEEFDATDPWLCPDTTTPAGTYSPVTALTLSFDEATQSELIVTFNAPTTTGAIFGYKVRIPSTQTAFCLWVFRVMFYPCQILPDFSRPSS